MWHHRRRTVLILQHISIISSFVMAVRSLIFPYETIKWSRHPPYHRLRTPSKGFFLTYSKCFGRMNCGVFRILFLGITHFLTVPRQYTRFCIKQSFFLLLAEKNLESKYYVSVVRAHHHNKIILGQGNDNTDVVFDTNRTERSSKNIEPTNVNLSEMCV